MKILYKPILQDRFNTNYKDKIQKDKNYMKTKLFHQLRKYKILTILAYNLQIKIKNSVIISKCM